MTLLGRSEFPLSEDLERLAKSIKQQKAAVFCGAGISLHSGIPLVSQLVPYILEKLSVSPQGILDAKGGLQIPFEVLVGSLIQRSRADRFLDIFGAKDASKDILVPNLNHILIAQLIKAGYLNTIVTTNFDRLLEKALGAQGLHRYRDYLVFYNEDGFSQIAWNDPRPRLIKIHGSVEDRGSIGITFETVEHRGFSVACLEVIRHIFSTGTHDAVLVLGYSSSDKFDLTPHIRTCSLDPKEVFYVEHSSESRTEPLDVKGYGGPFLLFRNGKRLFCNTDEFIKALWNTFFPNDEYQLQLYESRWRENVDEWNAAILDPFQHLLAGDILNLAAKPDEAAQRYEAALVFARRMGSLRLQSEVMSSLGEARRDLGQYILARTLYEESLSIAEALGDQGMSSRVRQLLRNLPGAMSSERAAQELEEARRAASGRHNPREEASILINLGNDRMVHQEYDKALTYFEQALDLLHRDLRGTALVLNNMGLAYVRLRQLEMGELFYRLSLEMSNNFGDQQGVGTTAVLLGELYVERRDHEAALKLYEQSLSIARAIGDAAMEAKALCGLMAVHQVRGQKATSSVFGAAMRAVTRVAEQRDLSLRPEIQRFNEEAKLSFLLGRYDLGVQQFGEALSKARDLGDRRGQILTLNNMGIASVGLNEPFAGVGYHEEALELSRQIDDRDLEIGTLSHLSKLYSHIGQSSKVLRYYEDSLSRAREAGQREKEIDYSNLLAKAYDDLGEPWNAVGALESALRLSRETKSSRLEGVILNNLGNAYNSLEQFGRAADFFQQAVRIFQSLHLDGPAAAAQSALEQMLRKSRATESRDGS